VSAEPIIETLRSGRCSNCTVIADPVSREAIVIDPGDEPERILRALASAKPRRWRSSTRTRTSITSRARGRSRKRRERRSGCIRPTGRSTTPARTGRLLRPARGSAAASGHAASDGERIRFGPYVLRAVHTPGHTPGSTCFLLEGDHPMLFAGDTLFRRSVGRTDLWGGDTDTILASIREKLFTLPGDVPVVCGHGPGRPSTRRNG
jgi:glyoxylase-like metal-dependent hydrolase (beta-lactamase superfamily II)